MCKTSCKFNILSVNRVIDSKYGPHIHSRRFYDACSALAYADNFESLTIFNENIEAIYRKRNGVVVFNYFPKEIDRNKILLVDFRRNFNS